MRTNTACGVSVACTSREVETVMSLVQSPFFISARHKSYPSNQVNRFCPAGGDPILIVCHMSGEIESTLGTIAQSWNLSLHDRTLHSCEYMLSALHTHIRHKCDGEPWQYSQNEILSWKNMLVSANKVHLGTINAHRQNTILQRIFGGVEV